MPATFTRAGVAYKQDGSQVADGVPRYETGKYGQAIMVEEGTENTLSSVASTDFSDASWTKAGCSVTAATAPDGTMTADKLTEDAANSQHFAVHSDALLTVGQPGTISVYAKAGERFRLWIASGSPRVSVNLNTGVIVSIDVGATATIDELDDGWYRITASMASLDLGSFYLGLEDASGASSYLGDGASGLYLWHPQAEQKAFATSWQIGGTARAAETLAISTAGVLSDSAGTIEGWWYENEFASGTMLWSNFAAPPFIYSDATNYITHCGSVATFVRPSVGWHHIAFTWAGGTGKTYLDGVLKTTQTASPTWSSSPLRIGVSDVGTLQWNSLIDDVRISSTAHSAAKILADYTAGPAQYE